MADEGIQTQTVKPDTRERDGEDKKHENGMVPAAERLERHHLAAAPGAADPLPNPFPAAVVRGLGAGVGTGAVVGLLVGILLYQNVLIVPGWEQLYSAGNVTFYVLWTLFGVAAGILFIGGGSLLLISPEAHELAAEDQSKRDHESEDGIDTAGQ